MSSLIDRMGAPSIPGRGAHHRTRIQHALTVTGFPDHLERINNCSKNRRCNSTYCSKCRVRHVREHTNRMIGLHRSLYGNNDNLARNNLRFVTILHELRRLDITEIRDSLTRSKSSFTSVRRSFPGLRFEGRFEVEAVDTKVIFNSDLCPQKTRALLDLNDGNRSVANRDMALVHSHALVLLGNNNPESVRERLTAKFPGRYAVKIDKLYEDQLVEESIRKICSYLLKDRVFYNNHMRTDGYKEGRYIEDSSLSFLIRSGMSDKIGISSGLIYSKG